MRVNAVVQARMGSSRLPGKVLLPLGGRLVLDRVVDAARAAPGVDEVLVATSTDPGDDPVAERAAALGVGVVRGSEDDVLLRFVQATDEYPCDAVVRLTADCPLLDPDLIGLVVAAWRHAPWHDYVATTLVRTLPRGMDVELARADTLRTLSLTAQGHDRVHVMTGLYAEPGRFSCLGLVVAPATNHLRVTLDTLEDLHALEGLVELLGERTSWGSVSSLLEWNPHLVARNAHVRQKTIDEG